MMSNIKLYLSIAAAAVIGVLYAMFRVQKSEKEATETKLKQVESVANENKNTIEIQHSIEKVRNDVITASNDDLDGMLNEYDRSRKD